MGDRLPFLLYKGASILAGILGWPFYYRHLKRRGGGESFLPRLGLSLPTGLPPGSPRVWLHGVSVGEILAAVPLVTELRKLLPDMALIISTGTETGQTLARQHFEPQGALVCYFPLDVPWAVNGYLNRLKPQVFAALESEIWPNFLTAARHRGVRLALLNARLSDKSYRRYLSYKKYVFDFINYFEIIAAGSPQDHRRLLDLGLPSHKVRMTGNLKVDRLLGLWQSQGGPLAGLPLPSPAAHLTVSGDASGEKPASGSLAERLNLKGEPVFLAASTHPGEEEAVLSAYEKIRGPYPALLLILAPRHPERAPEVGRLLSARGLGFQFWQRLKSGGESRQSPVVIVDTIGDLFNLYGVADVAFVGGSIIPHGGQNILEPAAWGLTPLYGPHLSNFLWAKEILEGAGAGQVVTDAASLAAAALDLLDHPEERRRRGYEAQKALTPHQGAARRQARLVAEMMASKV